MLNGLGLFGLDIFVILALTYLLTYFDNETVSAVSELLVPQSCNVVIVCCLEL